MENLPIPELPLNIEDIKKCIPHRYPFLLVDRVSLIDPGKKIVARKAITITDGVFQGHFPDNPVYPGVLLIEGLAQTAAVLGNFTLPNGLKACLLTEVGKTRFRKPVVPGDLLEYEVNVTRMRPPFHWFEGIAKVDGEVAAIVSFSAHIS